MREINYDLTQAGKSIYAPGQARTLAKTTKSAKHVSFQQQSPE